MNNKMTFTAKMLTDRSMFGKSSSLEKIVENAKCKKSDRAEIIVFRDSVKSLLPLAFEIFRDRMAHCSNPNNAATVNQYKDAEELRNKLYAKIASIIGDIGDVGYGKLICHAELYEHCVNHSWRWMDEYHGKAFTVRENLSAEKKTLKNYMKAPNGVNAEAISTTAAKIERMEKELDELKKKPGMVTTEWGITNATSFTAEIERFLSKVATAQLPLTAEELKEKRAEAKKAQDNLRKSAAAANGKKSADKAKDKANKK